MVRAVVKETIIRTVVIVINSVIMSSFFGGNFCSLICCCLTNFIFYDNVLANTGYKEKKEKYD